jgi:hypothetical protein
MNLEQALLVLTTQIMGRQVYDHQIAEKTAAAIAEVIQSEDDTLTASDYRDGETLLRIARYESGGFREDVASCKTRGDSGEARGLFQVHGFSATEKVQLCSSDYREQVKVALGRVRGSIQRCANKGLWGSHLLTEYTHGTCKKEQGNAARLRWGSGKALEKLVHTDTNSNAIMPKHPGAEILVYKNEELN